MPRDGLTDKLEKFAQGIARGMTLTAAGIAAGWSEHTASAAAHRASKRPEVQARVAEIRVSLDAARAEAMVAVEMPTREQVLRQLLEACEVAKRGGQLQQQLRAIELIGKELGMFVQRSSVEVSSPLAALSAEALLALSQHLEAPDEQPEEEPQPAEAGADQGQSWL